MELNMETPVLIVGDVIGNNGKVAVTRGPLVFAADSAYLPRGRLLEDVVLNLPTSNPAQEIEPLPVKNGETIHLKVRASGIEPAFGDGLWKEKERYKEIKRCSGPVRAVEIELVPFFEAGNREPDVYRDGFFTNSEPARRITYQVWLPYSCV